MISRLRGEIIHLGLELAVIDIGGVGLDVFATPTTLSQLRVGETATLSTTLVVREESLTLFGFSDDDEREVFLKLQTVSGVGPKLALAILAVHTPNQLRSIMANEDAKALQRVPGIGKKSASRLILELGDKLGTPIGVIPSEPDSVSAVSAHSVLAADVINALVGLGWNEPTASKAVADIQAQMPEETSLSVLLRAALRQLGGHRV